MRSYRHANLDERQLALREYAEKLTLAPRTMSRVDVERLRDHGLSDRDVLDVVEIVAYFNYINRIADGLGVDLEPEMPPR